MNERIQELAYEAEDYADSIVDQGGEFHPAYTKKFANLMVQRFLDLIGDQIISLHYLEDAEGKETMYEFKEVVKTYFGVEK